MSAEDVIIGVLNRSILVVDWPDDERDAYRNTAGSTIKKYNAVEQLRVQKILDAVRAEQQEPEVPDPGPRGDVGPRGQAGLKGPSGIKIEMTPEGAAKMNEALAKFVTRPRWWPR